MPLPIETERLILRPKTLADVEPLLEIFTDPLVMRFFAGGATTREGVRELVERDIAHQEAHGFSLWAVLDRETGKVIGDAGFQHLEDGPEIEIGIRLGRRYWGARYADEIARALWDYGIHDLQLEQAVGIALPRNRASRALMERSGMRFVEKGTYYGKPGVKYVGTRADYARMRGPEDAAS